jgi:ribosomal protein L11 methylase PrmA
VWAINALLILLVGLAISFVWTSLLGAPWVPSSMKMVHKMLSMAEVGSEDVVYDLGCGDGRMIVAAARKYGARAVGIEIDPLRYLWCKALISILGLSDRVSVVSGNFFSQDLSEADVVTCFLVQATNLELESKLMRELKPGTRVVSNRFAFPGLYKVRQDGEAKLYLCNFLS